jgi:hypothetical protein
MKHFLLILIILILPVSLFSQRDTIYYANSSVSRELTKNVTEVNISIYPVPVRDNTFTIRSDKEMSAIKITNIIGQDIYSIKYVTSQLLSKIILDNPRRGMYMVVIQFSDNSRIVKKVMVESNY